MPINDAKIFFPVDHKIRLQQSQWLAKVRWLSGRKQRFAKAPYSKRVPRVRIPPSPLFFRIEGRRMNQKGFSEGMNCFQYWPIDPK